MEKLTIARTELSTLIERINSAMSWADYPTKENLSTALSITNILKSAKFQTKHLFDDFNGYSLDVEGIFKHMTEYKGQCSTVEMVFILAYNIYNRADYDGRISRKSAEKASSIISQLSENVLRNIRRECLCGELSSGLISMLFDYIETREAE